MSNENDLRSRLVPAICTQCGGQVQVDPSQEAAVCQYCGTPFIVEKAIQNYSIQNAKIEHVDTVNINTKGTVMFAIQAIRGDTDDEPATQETYVEEQADLDGGNASTSDHTGNFEFSIGG